MFKVYIISNKEGILYKGFTTDLEKRLDQHNSGKSQYTAYRGPWKLVFYKTFHSKTEALQYEKMLKRQNHRYLTWLIKNETNEMPGGRLG